MNASEEHKLLFKRAKAALAKAVDWTQARPEQRFLGVGMEKKNDNWVIIFTAPEEYLPALEAERLAKFDIFDTYVERSLLPRLRVGSGL